jgi:hypothetical protein
MPRRVVRNRWAASGTVSSTGHASRSLVAFTCDVDGTTIVNLQHAVRVLVVGATPPSIQTNALPRRDLTHVPQISSRRMEFERIGNSLDTATRDPRPFLAGSADGTCLAIARVTAAC